MGYGDFNPRSPYGERHWIDVKDRLPSNFNPRSPYGERRPALDRVGHLYQFQSTLPLRGATGKMHPKGATICDFNPRSPYGERPLGYLATTLFIVISIHAPLTGSDYYISGVAARKDISIHAPLTGSDIIVFRRYHLQNNFNPRSPYGERRTGFPVRLPTSEFQSTLPLRGATAKLCKAWPEIRISIHAPLTGSDSDWYRDPLAS